MDYSAARTAIACAPPITTCQDAGAANEPIRPDSRIRPEPRKKGESLLEYGQRLHRSELRRLKMKHSAGMGGREVTLYRSQLLDHLVREMYEASLAKDAAGSSNMAIIAIGGYGRKELAPFSDVDLMFLVKSRRSQKEAQQIQFMLCQLWDMGLQVGHSVRTLKEALQMGNEDLVSLNSMLDARLLAGSQEHFSEFEEKLGQTIKRNRKSVVERMLRTIEERHLNQGGTAFIQEPDIKEAKGGLRDFHFAGWIASALYPGQRLEQVLHQHQITPAEWTRARQSYEFLQRLRNELHFCSNRKTDVLSHSVLATVAGVSVFERVAGRKTRKRSCIAITLKSATSRECLTHSRPAFNKKRRPVVQPGCLQNSSA